MPKYNIMIMFFLFVCLSVSSYGCGSWLRCGDKEIESILGAGYVDISRDFLETHAGGVYVLEQSRKQIAEAEKDIIKVARIVRKSVVQLMIDQTNLSAAQCVFDQGHDLSEKGFMKSIIS